MGGCFTSAKTPKYHSALVAEICTPRKDNLVPRPLFFRFCLVTAKKRVWWISVGRFVLLTPRFWELLIDVNNYKGHPLNNVPLLRV